MTWAACGAGMAASKKWKTTVRVNMVGKPTLGTYLEQTGLLRSERKGSLPPVPTPAPHSLPTSTSPASGCDPSPSPFSLYVHGVELVAPIVLGGTLGRASWTFLCVKEHGVELVAHFVLGGTLGGAHGWHQSSVVAGRREGAPAFSAFELPLQHLLGLAHFRRGCAQLARAPHHLWGLLVPCTCSSSLTRGLGLRALGLLHVNEVALET